MTELKGDLLALETFSAERRAPARIRDNLKAGCWIYGAGGYGLRVFNALEAHGFECLGFIDQRAAEKDFASGLPRPVWQPDCFDPNSASGRTLIIGVMNTLNSFSEPQAWAQRHKFLEILLPGHLPEVLGAELTNYWMVERGGTAPYIDEIVALTNMLADEESVKTIAALARFRISGDIEMHPSVDIQHQYSPPGLPLPKDNVILVDGGAYTGDTYASLVRLGVQIDEWYAFEPDLLSFKALAEVAQTAGGKAALFPCGLSNRSTDVLFADGEGAASHVSFETAASTISARVLALDDTLVGANPTYIKLDIEGFEAEALEGMKGIIKTAKPALAVCIYHKPADLWELPLLVRRLMPKSKLYVRQHGHNGFDTVLYAVPDECAPG